MIASSAEQGAALLRGVLDDPEDDLARLVYADWLEEEGKSERAEFIRVQIDLNRLLPPGETPTTRGAAHWLPLRRRERGLLDTHAAGDDPNWVRWAGAALNLVPGSALYCDHLTFRRGFVEAVRCPLAAWDAHGAAVLAAHPVVRVEAPDKEPERHRGDGSTDPAFGWFRVPEGGDEGDEPAHDELPASLWEHLPPSTVVSPHQACWRWYDSPEAARDALSAALIAWRKPP